MSINIDEYQNDDTNGGGVHTPKSKNIIKKKRLSFSSSSSLSSPKTLIEDSNSNNDNNNNASTADSNRNFKRDHEEFKMLDSEIGRFCSKTGVHKANVVRLALLPFLREQRAEYSNILKKNLSECSFRIKVLQKWWVSLLSTLRDKCHPISNSDRNCYLEAISGLMARDEWNNPSFVNTTTRYIYESLLYDTIKLAISKLCLKTVPLSLSAFCGKVLAYGFFFAPGIAPVLIHLLRVSQENIDRIVEVNFNSETDELNELSTMIKNYFPVHITRLIGHAKGINTLNPNDPNNRLRPKAPPQLPDLYGPWTRRWASTNSDVFIAFIKHYYSIISYLLPNNLPLNAHLASPGLIILHSFILGGFESFVKIDSNGGASGSSSSTTASPKETYPDTIAVSPIQTSAATPSSSSSSSPGNKKRVDQIKMLSAIREILHNDDNCLPYYEAYSRQFEKILHAITLKTSLFDVHSCISLADLIEEYISSLVLDHYLTRPRVQIQKDEAIDWKFWIRVVEKMLSSENSSTELRALALLFNLWENIPISSYSQLDANDEPQPNGGEDDELEFYLSSSDGLKWGVTCWLLSDRMWKKYFCHWQPLVRSYYQRILCWRIASVGNESELLSSILFSNYNSDARYLLKTRLLESFIRMEIIINDCVENSKSVPALEAVSPVVNRKLTITLNPACGNNSYENESTTRSLGSSTPGGITTPTNNTQSANSSSHSQLRRVNAFDVFDDIAYSYSTNNTYMTTAELFPTNDGGGGGSRASQETVRTTTATPNNNDDYSNANTNNNSNANSGTNTPNTNGASTITSISNVIKKKWYKLTGNGYSSSPNLKRYSSVYDFSQPNASINTRSVSGQSSPSFSSLSSSINTPVSGASSISTPPTPGSIKSSGSMDNLSTANGKKNNKKKHNKNSSSLIPAPRQLLRQTPEIARSKYRFSLEFCEKSASKQYEAITRKNNTHNNMFLKSRQQKLQYDIIKPRLPFEFKDDPLLGLDDNNDIEEEEKELEETIRNKIVNENDIMDIKWKYSGKSLTEWASTIGEFEEFVRSRKTLGVSRLEDIGIPFLIAELPAKLKAG